jgi:bifunctional UDP-N-acetylglucosamine pyrophosphorylase / glucosamine-1-phosphate N-acetyltransferase
MLSHLADRYRPHVESMVVIVHPDWRPAVAAAASTFVLPVRLVEQGVPTGMLDAVLIGLDAAQRASPDRFWITWCDQVGVLPDTLARLARADVERQAALVFPTVRPVNPYIHFDRDATGRIAAVRQRREGDAMPAVGEGDMGLFSLSLTAARLLVTEFAPVGEAGAGTGERNFLPFIPWLAARHPVDTIPATDPSEAIGINTPEELRAVEAFLHQRRLGC